MSQLLTSIQFGGHGGSLIPRHIYNKSSVIKLYSVSSKHKHEKKTYYDVLGVSKKCTHIEIKHAYYRLSKLFHPDVNKTDIAHERFQTITEAYEVLGNVHKRRIYDKGLYNPLHPESVVHPSQKHKRGPDVFTQMKYSPRRPPPTGRSKIYNFDEFYKQHYGEMLKRDQKSIDEKETTRKEYETVTKQNYERAQHSQSQINNSKAEHSYAGAGIVLSGIVFVCWWLFN